MTALLAKWVPLRERATIGSLVYAGSQFGSNIFFNNCKLNNYSNFLILGTILSNAISGELIRYTQDWASVFYFFGALGIIWFIFWVLLCYSDPQSHPFISDKEKEYLNRELCKYKFNLRFKLVR